MNRIDRLSAILIKLQSRRRVTAGYLSEKFSVSLRTVYRDVHALQEAGVPVIGEAGSGYSIMEGYSLPPVAFNREEASALLTAGKLMQSKTDEKLSYQYNAALDKMRAVLRVEEKDHVDTIDEHVAVIEHPSFRYTPPSDLHLQTILKAVGENEIIDLTYSYLENNIVTRRIVEPVGIYYLGNYWHLVAFCRLRDDYRNFRTDRIKKLIHLDQKATRLHPPLREFIDKMNIENDVTKVVIEVDPEITKYFGEQKYYMGFVNEESRGAKVRMTFLSGSLTGFARWFMLFGDDAEIIEPAHLNNLVSEMAKNILKKINGAKPMLT
jgi:predicted DNA-binding transcriptional regulator YafY